MSVYSTTGAYKTQRTQNANHDRKRKRPDMKFIRYDFPFTRTILICTLKGYLYELLSLQIRQYVFECQKRNITGSFSGQKHFLIKKKFKKI